LSSNSAYVREIDDEDDEDTEKSELLNHHHHPLPFDIEETTSADYNNLDSTSSSTSSSSSSPSAQTQNVKLDKIDQNNNVNKQEQVAVGSEPNVVILDDKVLLKNRSDSIRMRHNSTQQNINNNANNTRMNPFVNNSEPKREKRLRSFNLSKGINLRLKKKEQNFIIVFILCIVNLLNYIDRYTCAGVLSDIQKYFDINDAQSGLLQTLFICSYMLLAPLFGYLGDRYSRKWIIIFGISFWSLMTFFGSFVPGDKFWLFALMRSLVGVGEASYSCVAPTIIGDLFTNELRTKVLAVFYLAVPVGSGLGYIIGSNIASAFGDWRWALRMTPPLGLLCVLLLIFVVKDPTRGGADGQTVEQSETNMWQDIVYLWKNKTFVWTTLGFTFASFVLGGLSWWVPLYVEYSIYSNNETPEQIPLIFGVVTCLSGLIGVSASSVIASKLRQVVPYADPLVCALGSFLAVPSLFVLIMVTRSANVYVFWLLAAFAISSMCLSWTIVADILLYTIYPTKRSIASAFNILICHLLGDAFSPYVIGLISDSLKKGKPDTYYTKFSSLQMALYAGPFFAAISFACYMFASIYVVEDKKIVDIAIKKNQSKNALNEASNPTSPKDLTANVKINKSDPDITNISDANNNTDQNSLVTENETLNSKNPNHQYQPHHQHQPSNAQSLADDLLTTTSSSAALFSK
jgi:MFS family permease